MTVKTKVAEDSKLECEKIVENKTTMRSRTEKTTFFDPMAVTWMEKYNDKIEKIWSTLPTLIRTSIATCAIVLLGATIRGEWLLVFVHFARHFGYTAQNDSISSNATSSSINWAELSLESFYLQNLSYIWLFASIISYSMYFTIGGFLHVIFTRTMTVVTYIFAILVPRSRRSSILMHYFRQKNASFLVKSMYKTLVSLCLFSMIKLMPSD